MQVSNNDGILGAIQEYNEENMKKALSDTNTGHVEVFEGTEEELERRGKLVGKKKFSVKKRFQKTGSNKKKWQ
jgi:predicted ATPase